MSLSVIIPVFNAEKYMDDCLESLIECPYRDMECIIINDGSQDASLEICQRYAKKDSRISVTTIANSGVSVARNVGIEMAQGTYIMFLDADDKLKKPTDDKLKKPTDDKLKKSIWESLSEQMAQKYEFVSYAYDILDEKNVWQVRPEYYINLGEKAESVDYQYLCKLLFGTSQLNTCWGKLYLRQVIEEHSIRFKEELKIGEDAIFVLDYLSQVTKVKIINESLLYYRQHTQSVMKNILGILNDLTPLIQARNEHLKKWKIEENLKKDLLIEGKRLSFSILTDLYRKAVEERSYSEIKKLYTEISKTKGYRHIFELVSRKEVKFGYKRVEYVMIRCHLKTLMILYYKIKANLGALR